MSSQAITSFCSFNVDDHREMAVDFSDKFTLGREHRMCKDMPHFYVLVCEALSGFISNNKKVHH